MQLTVLGGCGVWPAAGQACSGYLLEHEGFRLLIDPGYAVLPQLLRYVSVDEVDAVLVSHGHPDHCSDLNPLLRARALRDQPAPPLAVHALPNALDAVLALDRPGMLDDAIDLHDIEPGATITVGAFDVTTRALPHSRPNVGFRVVDDGAGLVYTGDAAPDPGLVELAQGADVLLAEATYLDDVPADSLGTLSSARSAGRQASEAGVSRLLLTHLPPGSDPDAWRDVARRLYSGPIDVARAGIVLTPSDRAEAPPS